MKVEVDTVFEKAFRVPPQSTAIYTSQGAEKKQECCWPNDQDTHKMCYIINYIMLQTCELNDKKRELEECVFPENVLYNPTDKLMRFAQ